MSDYSQFIYAPLQVINVNFCTCNCVELFQRQVSATFGNHTQQQSSTSFQDFFFFVRKTFKICYEGADHQKSKKKKGFVNNLCVFNHCKSFSLVGCFQKYALKLVLARNFEGFYFQDLSDIWTKCSASKNRRKNLKYELIVSPCVQFSVNILQI